MTNNIMYFCGKLKFIILKFYTMLVVAIVLIYYVIKQYYIVIMIGFYCLYKMIINKESDSS